MDGLFEFLAVPCSYRCCGHDDTVTQCEKKHSGTSAYCTIGFCPIVSYDTVQIIEFLEHHKNDPKPESNDENDDDDFNRDQYEPKKYKHGYFLSYTF